MKRCLMLDVDGVLVNGRPQDGKSWATDIERDLGIAPGRLQSVFFVPHWQDIVIGRKHILDVLDTCMSELSASIAPREFVDYWFERDSRIDERVLADCDALRARGIRIFLATNQEHLRADFLMTRLGLANHVDGMIHSAGIAARKPDRAFFDIAAQRSGELPGDILMVDDTAANVDAAAEAGWAAEHWTRGSSLLSLFDGC